jgi:hypothetical protein
MRHVWAIVIFTATTLPPQRLESLYKNFQKAYNTGTWNGKVLDPPACDLTPTHLLSHSEGIGKWICAADLERIIKKLYPTFAPGTGWGATSTNNQAILATFWPKGKWNLKNSSTFGVPGTWMSPEARIQYSKHNSNKKTKK